MCRLGAIELSKTYSILEKKYPGIIQVFGFGPDDLGLDEFKELGIFKQPIFVPKIGPKFYKIFQCKQPGFLKCFGFCNKNLLKRYDEAKKYDTGYTFKGNFAQLGGCFILNKQGKILYQRFDSYLGDHASSDEVIAQFDNLLKYREVQKTNESDDRDNNSSKRINESSENNDEVDNISNNPEVKSVKSIKSEKADNKEPIQVKEVKIIEINKIALDGEVSSIKKNSSVYSSSKGKKS